jgi:hypothetical protein
MDLACDQRVANRAGRDEGAQVSERRSPTTPAQHLDDVCHSSMVAETSP